MHPLLVVPLLAGPLLAPFFPLTSTVAANVVSLFLPPCRPTRPTYVPFARVRLDDKSLISARFSLRKLELVERIFQEVLALSKTSAS